MEKLEIHEEGVVSVFQMPLSENEMKIHQAKGAKIVNQLL